jgi:NADH dehydrogenase FAD-containing subunit
MDAKKPHVVIVGGGFGGVAAAKALRGAPVRITLIDRMNHHVFQPLLYQVATSVLSPGDIASPIRGILRRQANVSVTLGEVISVDKAERNVTVKLSDGTRDAIRYDYLVLATGARHSYFGKDEYEQHAPGLKSVADALALRNRILHAFELAETTDDPVRKGLVTFVLVGAGPTGVEMAGAMATLVRRTLKSSFRRIDPRSARIILVDQANRILGPFSEALSRKAQQHLEDLGVEVRLGHGIEQIDGDGVVVDGERIMSKTVIWTAGVAASAAGKWLGAETDRAGRVHIQQNLTIAGYPEVFVIGDTASLHQDGKALPGVAQVAMQQGRYAGKLIHRRVTGRKDMAPFRYFDKGNMAVVGGNFAVLQCRKVQLSGWLGWLPWATIHIAYLAHASLRLAVLVQWLWTYLTGQRGSVLIVNHHASPQTKSPRQVVQEIGS